MAAAPATLASISSPFLKPKTLHINLKPTPIHLTRPNAFTVRAAKLPAGVSEINLSYSLSLLETHVLLTVYKF